MSSPSLKLGMDRAPSICLAHGEDNVLHMIYIEVDPQCVCLYATQSRVMKEGIERSWWKENDKVYFYWCPLATTNK